MKNADNTPLIRTIKEQCRVCYTCVRECPAKAIRITEGRAEIIVERCLACGNCVRVCSQHAKQAASSIDSIMTILQSGSPIAACVAPSFPAEFEEIDYRQLVGMLRRLGFSSVHEVAFGADLVAKEYRKLVEDNKGKRYIATTCPSIVAYVERYHPDLVSSLAPIVSPMVATGRFMRRLYGNNTKIVFIGPCIAKKGEAASENLESAIDGVLMFAELRHLFITKNIKPDDVEPSEFDLPHPGSGSLFPVSRGMLQAAGISEDLLTGEVVAADGRTSFTEAIKEFGQGHLDANLLEVLCCHGCIMGAGMTSTKPLFHRRSLISQSVRDRMNHTDMILWRENLEKFSGLDLHRTYVPDDRRLEPPADDDLKTVLARMGKFEPEDELNCGACGYETCREHAIAICKGFAESEMCLPYTIEQLKNTVSKLNVSNDQLAKAQEALIQSEKLAHMGQLAAGIAHELNNPLGVVLMYAHLLLDEVETKSQLYEDAGMIAEQADRCKKIVSGLLHFSRQNKTLLKSIDMRDLVQRGLKTLNIPDNVRLVVRHDETDSIAEIDGDQIIQVLTNLVHNAIAAMPDGGGLTVRTSENEHCIILEVADTGVGIPKENLRKIFEPFFTTKQIGEGTGLGLAITYGIVKMHRGDIKVESNADKDAGVTGTTFKVELPRYGRNE
jgi:iron only hydrogenase large subunit-like protein/nitrogen-specific signal transduction histidine kinase